MKKILRKILAIPYDSEKTLIGKFKDTGKYFFRTNSDIPRGEPQQLILLNHEEIFDLDFCYNTTTEKIVIIWKPGENTLSDANKLSDELGYGTCTIEAAIQYEFPKIIATHPQIKNLPIFQLPFIKSWIKTPVNEVLVEYCDYVEVIDKGCPAPLNTTTLINGYEEIFCSIPCCNCMEITCDICEPKIDNKIMENAAITAAAELAYGQKQSQVTTDIEAVMYKCYLQGFRDSKSFHSEKLYTDEEVETLLNDYKDFLFTYIDRDNVGIDVDKETYEWFEENKKKS